jgi:hypothetical protein
MRGREVTRLESFSDAVFGFALTLLVVSLEVPKSFADLIDAMQGFPGFAVCFTMLAMLWNSHYKFSRRYGCRLDCCGIGADTVVLGVGWADLSFAFPGLARISHDPSATTSCANCYRRYVEL